MAWGFNGTCGPVVLDDGGRSWRCMGCGVSVDRVRVEPYPPIPHKKPKRSKRPYSGPKGDKP